MSPTAEAARRLFGLAACATAGSLVAIWLDLPVPLMTGPAALTAAVSLAGWHQHFPIRLRDAVFLVAGIAIGTGVSRDSLAAIATWPLAFLIMTLGLLAMMQISASYLARVHAYDRRSAVLASSPGHMSFVFALGEASGSDVRAIVVAQSVRVMSLTLLVPLAARAFGIETGIGLTPPGAVVVEMSLRQTALCIVAALALFPLVRAARLPAPVLLAGMIVGAAARLSDLAPGGLSHWLSYPALALIGTLIGTRFSGVTLAELRRYGAAGLAITLVAAALSAAAAWLASSLVGMPFVQVLVAFAPGGLETMNVLGAAIGADPGFVAAGHVLRLLMLSFLVPYWLGRVR